MAADIHIYIRDAYAESRNLRMQADEVEQRSKELEAQAEQLMSVWRGASARRVAAAMLGRCADARKISDNLNIISDGLYRTARTYDEAQKQADTADSSWAKVVRGGNKIVTKVGNTAINVTIAQGAGGSSGGAGSSRSF